MHREELPGVAEKSVRLPEGQRLELARERLMVALDVPDAASALELARRLEGACRWVKVGLELYTASGPSVVERLAAQGYKVFLDLKFHDIPNTVSGAVRSAASLGAGMMTLHGGGGPAMLAAAQGALAGLPEAPQLLVVTVLTSMDRAQLEAVGVGADPAEQVERLVRLGLGAGIRGFVCSAQEVERMRQVTGPEGVLVTPGIRPAGAEVGDQKRIATPEAALRQGASYLVVGRPITQAARVSEAAETIVREMAEGLVAGAEARN